MGEVALRPRLCHIVKWPDFDGYGFNLHAEKNRPGQYIGKVDPNSPAEMAGLREGDKIVEVNGVNINQENHKQVVGRIKAEPNQTRLLVVDAACEAYHKEQGIIITGSLPNILKLSSQRDLEQEEEDEERIDTRIQKLRETSPSPRADHVDNKPAASSKSGHQSPTSASHESVRRAAAPAPYRHSHHEEEEEEDDDHIVRRNSRQLSHHHDSVQREDSLMSDRTLSNRSSVSSGKAPNSLSSGSPRSTPSPVNHTSSGGGGGGGGLDLPLTAKEMRERIGSRKKKDPRKDDRMDFRKKFEIIQTL